MNLRVFRSDLYRQEAEAVRKHCFASALACRALGAFTPLSPEYLYMVGLLHDVGIVVALGALETLTTRRDLSPFPSALYWPAIMSIHEEVNSLLCRRWNLPAELHLLLSQHHHVMLGGQPHPVLAVLSLAEVFADLRGLGVTRRGGRTMNSTGLRPDQRSQHVVEQALEALGMSESQFDLARARTDDVFSDAFGIGTPKSAPRTAP